MANAVEKAYAAIRASILSGEFPPGDHLKEEQLAARIGISRTPVREALRRLNAEAVVEFVPNQGAFVAKWSAEEVRDIFQMRSLLEGLAVERAARYATEAQVEELSALAEEMIALGAAPGEGTIQRIAEANSRFHQTIIAAASSARLSAVIAQIIQIPVVLRTFHRYDPHALQRSLFHHREIVAALRARDGEWAASVMRSHILAAWHALEQAPSSPLERRPTRSAAE